MKLAIGFIVPIILAIQIYELNDGFLKKMLQTISYLSHFLSWVILGGMLITWLSISGLFNQILSQLGLGHHAQNFLLNASSYCWMPLYLKYGKVLVGERFYI